MNQMKIWEERENKPFQVQKEKLVGGWSGLLGDKAQIPDILPHSGAPVCVCVEWNQLEIQQSTLQSFLDLRSPLLLSLFQPPGDLWPFSSSALHFIYIFSPKTSENNQPRKSKFNL
jgi:hypothetical protein